MFIALEQSQLIHEDKIFTATQSCCYFDHFNPDILNSKLETRGKTVFFYTLTSAKTLFEIIEICPLTIPSESILISTYMPNLNQIN